MGIGSKLLGKRKVKMLRGSWSEDLHGWWLNHCAKQPWRLPLVTENDKLDFRSHHLFHEY